MHTENGMLGMGPAGNARLERHAVYTFNARYAERWRAGRILLGGNAAHLMPPFAGQGMCAGLRDAANLAWKLDLVLAGHAREELLDTYQEERLPSARAAIEFSMELGKVICVPGPVVAAARDEAMAAEVSDQPGPMPGLATLTSGLICPGSPHAGEHLPQGADGSWSPAPSTRRSSATTPTPSSWAPRCSVAHALRLAHG